MKNLILIFLALLFLAGCSGEQENTHTQKKPPTDGSASNQIAKEKPKPSQHELARRERNAKFARYGVVEVFKPMVRVQNKDFTEIPLAHIRYACHSIGMSYKSHVYVRRFDAYTYDFADVTCQKREQR